MAIWIIPLLFIVLLVGVPIAFALGGVTSLSVLLTSVPIEVIAQKLFEGVDSISLIAIPLFILAGELMAKGGMSQRLINFANALVGHLPSGLAMVSVVACTFFAAITGSAIASTAAIGSIMIPVMAKEGYDTKFTLPLLACAGTIGPIIPPSIPLLVYGAAANTSIADLFIGGIVPGVLMGLVLCIASYWIGKKRNYRGTDQRAPFKEILVTAKDGILALIMPVIIVGGILSGVFTPTESAAVAVFYAWIIGFLVYRELPLREMWTVFRKSAILTGQILIIVAAAGLFTWFLTTNQIPQTISQVLTSSIDSGWVVLLIMNIVLLIAGTFIDTVSAIVVFTPIMVPIIQTFGFDPVHFGVVMSVNLSIGMVTPPLGVCLFVASSIGKVSMREILSKDLAIFVGLLIGVLLLISYVPSLVTITVNLFS